jgi:hypothetical protein
MSNFEEQVKSDMEINMYDLVDESRKLPNTIQTYTDYLHDSNKKLNKVKLKIDETVRGRFIYYMKDYDIKFNSSDARKMAESDDNVIKLRKIEKELQSTTEYLKNILWNLREKNKCISNAIQVKKMELG